MNTITINRLLLFTLLCLGFFLGIAIGLIEGQLDKRHALNALTDADYTIECNSVSNSAYAYFWMGAHAAERARVRFPEVSAETDEFKVMTVCQFNEDVAPYSSPYVTSTNLPY